MSFSYSKGLNSLFVACVFADKVYVNGSGAYSLIVNPFYIVVGVIDQSLSVKGNGNSGLIGSALFKLVRILLKSNNRCSSILSISLYFVFIRESNILSNFRTPSARSFLSNSSACANKS